MDDDVKSMATSMEDELNALEEEIDTLDELSENNGVYLHCEAWNDDRYIPLNDDDIGALVDRRVETMNELEHELNALESGD